MTCRQDRPSQGQPTPPVADDGRLVASMLGLALLLAVIGAGLYVLLGLPNPAELPGVPSLDTLDVLLRSPNVSPYGVYQIGKVVAWLVWVWAAGTLLVEVLLALAEGGPARGSASLRALRLAADRLACPLARPAAALSLVAQLTTHTPLGNVQASVVLAHTPLVVQDQAQQTAQSAAARSSAPAVVIAGEGCVADPEIAAPQAAPGADVIQHTVQPGETVGLVALRYYGTAHEFQRIIDANAGKVMASGRALDQTGVIEHGLVLDVPLPSIAIEDQDGVRSYIVERGDTLRGIAARILGDEERYQDLFDLNKGARTADGHVLTNPNLIWPKLRLRLPAATAKAEPATDGEEPDAGVSPTTVPDRAEHEDRARAASRQQTSAPETPATVAVAPAVPAPAAAPVDRVETLPTATEQPRRPPLDGLPPLWPLLPLAVGGVAAAAGVVGLRRWAGAPTLELGERGRLAAVPLRVLTRQVHGDPIELLAGELVRIAANSAVPDVEVVAAYAEAHAVSVVLRAPAETRARLPLLFQVAANHLARRVSAWQTADRDIRVLLEDPRPSAVEATGLPGTEPLLVSLGAVWHQELLVGWQALGHALVVSRPGTTDAQLQLQATVAMLAAQRSPDRLHLYICAAADSPLTALSPLPQQRLVGNSADGTRAVLAALERSLDEDAGVPGDPPIRVLVLGELALLAADEQTIVGRLAAQGATYNLRILAGTTDLDLASGALAQSFVSRVVFFLPDVDDSVRVLGCDDAVTVHPNGGMVVRIGGRAEVIEATGTEVLEEDLADLFAALGAAAGAPVRQAEPRVPPGGETGVRQPGVGGAGKDGHDDGMANGSPPPAAPEPAQEAAPTADGAAATEAEVGDTAGGDTPVATAEPSDCPAPVLAPDGTAARAFRSTAGPQAPSWVVAQLEHAPFVVQAMDRLALWYRQDDGSPRLLGPGAGPEMLSLLRGLEVLLFAGIARLWQSGGSGADDQELLEALWPGVDEAVARGNRVSALSKLKRQIRQLGIELDEGLHLDIDGLDGSRLVLNAKLCVSDVDAFCTAEERARRVTTGPAALAAAEAAVACYGGSLLADNDVLGRRRRASRAARATSTAADGTPPLAWLQDEPARRAQGCLEDRVRGLLLVLGDRLRGAGRFEEAAAVYRDVLSTTGRLRLRPTPDRAEKAVAGALTAVAALGNGSALEAEFAALQEALHGVELDVSDDLQDHFQRLLGPLLGKCAAA